MANFGRLTGLIRQQIDKRGGPDVAKQDLREVGDILKGQGTLKDKAKRSADALKVPGDQASAPPRDQQHPQS